LYIVVLEVVVRGVILKKLLEGLIEKEANIEEIVKGLAYNIPTTTSNSI